MKDFHIQAIRAAIDREVRKIIEVESEKAAKNVRTEIGKMVDGITLEVLQRYNVSQCGDTLTIEVRK